MPVDPDLAVRRRTVIHPIDCDCPLHVGQRPPRPRHVRVAALLAIVFYSLAVGGIGWGIARTAWRTLAR